MIPQSTSKKPNVVLNVIVVVQEMLFVQAKSGIPGRPAIESRGNACMIKTE